MGKIGSFLRRECAGWQMWEVIYILMCTTAIAVISAVLGDKLMGISSAVAGTLYTMFAGKGKISCYIFGVYNTIVYGWIARSYGLFGDMMLNWFVYLPMMFAGLVMWRKRLDADGSVIKTALSFRGRIIMTFFAAAGIVVYGLILKRMDDPQPFLDAATTVISVTAMIMTLKRCIEQWMLWTLVNALSVAMWLRVYAAGDGSVATLLWWLIMLTTGIVFYFNWRRELLKSPENPELG